MKKSTYLIALAFGVSTITFAQNVGINTDGSDPDANTLLHLNNHSTSSLDSALLRIENEKATTGTGVQIENSGTASSKWDIIVPGSSTDLRIKGNGSDHVTIQNDGDVGIGTVAPTVSLDVDGDAIFNESGADKDFRIEGDTDTEIFMVDASADAVGISTTTPVSGLDIQTSMGLNVTTITANTTLDQTHNVVLCNTGPYDVDLPAAASNTGKIYYIKNIDSDGDDITIDGNGDNIEGLSTIVLESYKDAIRIISDGDNWYIIDKSLKFDCGISTVSWTYNGEYVTYGTVLSSTGECWLDRNLGASQVATSSTDYLAYGDLFQWGRADDGHQEITWTNSTTGSAVNGTTSTNADTPGDALFITEGSSPHDWRVNQDDDLWNGEGATNNPCPSGWRLPTNTEWSSELTSESITNAASAYSSVLKLPVPGYRDLGSGSFADVGTNGRYWTSTSTRYHFYSGSAGSTSTYRAYGFSVRCIKD